MKSLKKKLKVAVVVGPFPCTSETFILNHITALIDAGCDVDIFAFGLAPEKQLYHECTSTYKLNEKVTYLFPIPYEYSQRFQAATKAAFWALVRNPLWLIRCARLKGYKRYGFVDALILSGHFMKKKYDVVHCHFGTNARKMCFLKEIFKSIRFVVTFHGYDLRKGLQEGGTFYKNLFKVTDKVVAICDYNAIKLQEMGCPKEKIEKIYNPINTETFSSDESKRQESFSIVTVARFVKEKNLFFALEVIKALKDQGITNFKYRMIGEGPLLESIKEKINTDGLSDYVELLGALTQLKVKEVLDSSNLLLLTSFIEGLPVVVLEAQSMSLPVIATNVGGVYQSLIDGKSGFLVELDNVDEVKNKIIQLMENPQQCKDMGANGRKFVLENFDSLKVRNQLLEIYSYDKR